MPIKIPKKHGKKEFPDQLLPLPVEDKNPVSYTLKAVARAEELFPITRLTEAQLRQKQLIKSPSGEPYFPKPVLGEWDTVATLRGLMALREHQASASATPRLDTVSFPSMESCEGATGITKTLQQLAKSKGCSAFRGPRVYLLDLIKWIFREAAAGNVADWGKMNTELDAKLKQVKLETELRELIRRDEAAECLNRFAAIVFSGHKRLEMETPRDLEMRPRDYIKKSMKEKLKTIHDQAAGELQKLAAESENNETVQTI